jgi:hypothetical protein
MFCDLKLSQKYAISVILQLGVHYFPYAFFVAVHLQLLLMFIYCGHESAFAKLIKHTDIAVHRVVTYLVLCQIYNISKMFSVSNVGINAQIGLYNELVSRNCIKRCLSLMDSKRAKLNSPNNF